MHGIISLTMEVDIIIKGGGSHSLFPYTPIYIVTQLYHPPFSTYRITVSHWSFSYQFVVVTGQIIA